MPCKKYTKVHFFCSNRKKVAKTDIDGNEGVVTISYKVKCK